LRDRDRKDAAVVDFLTAADGVTTLDSTDLDFEQTVAAVLDLVEATR
jgi:cytidylate kinase